MRISDWSSDVCSSDLEHETATQQHREALERYESVRDFDELARQNGRDLRQSRMQVNELENLLKSNPIAGLNKVLLQAGPRKADGQPFSLMDVMQFIVQKGPRSDERGVGKEGDGRGRYRGCASD